MIEDQEKSKANNLDSNSNIEIMEETPPTTPFHQKRMLFILLLIFFTEVLGFSLMMPILPFLAKDLGLNTFQIGALASIFSICQFFASPITGKLSDRYGRKPLLLISQFSTFIGFLLLGLADSVFLLILSRLIDGLLGSNMTVAQAAMSDLSKPENRTKIFSISSGVFGAGLIIGPGVGGLLAEIDLSLPMYIAAGVSFVSILLVVFFLPETYQHKSDKISLSIDDILPIKAIKKFIKTPKIRDQFLMLIAYFFAFMFFINNFTLILIGTFDATTSQSGYARSWIGVLRVLLQFFIMKKILKKYGENKLLKAGIISMVISMIIMIFTPTYWLIFIPLVFLAFGTGVARPILISQLTNSVGKKEYATVLGISNSINSLMQIISPLLGGLILEYYFAWPIMLTSAIIFGCLLLLMKMQAKNSELIVESSI